jgi:hypothetical protein
VSDVKLCIECMHLAALDGYVCGRDPAAPTSLVDGLPYYPSCESERSDADKCGPTGRSFEPRA